VLENTLTGPPRIRSTEESIVSKYASFRLRLTQLRSPRN
jgi:hypothetical protein